ncbi:hypothetical protein D3C81_787230 [compost metagenome]
MKVPVVKTSQQLSERHRLSSEWRLSESDLDLCAGHFLRNWTAHELQEQIKFSDTGLISIQLWDITYTPMIEVKQSLWTSLIYASLKGRDLNDPINDKPIKFWLSFRHGQDSAGEEFAYVIIQEDMK